MHDHVSMAHSGSPTASAVRIVRFLLLVGCLLLLAGPKVAYAGGVPVTACGEILEGKKGVLMNDLTCTGSRAILLIRSRLDLNGFTISGSGVLCENTCTVTGPGTITGSSRCGVRGDTDGLKFFGVARVKITDGVNITNNDCGIDVAELNAIGERVGSVSVQDSTVSGNAGVGVLATKSVKLKRTVVTGNGTHGVGEETAIGTWGTTKINIKDSDISGNGGMGVLGALKTKVTDSTVVDNGTHGVSGRRVRIGRTTVIGNGMDATCGITQTCADVASEADSTKLGSGTLCETSYVLDSGFPGTSLGVCSLD